MITPYIGQTIRFTETENNKKVNYPAVYLGMSQTKLGTVKPTIVTIQDDVVVRWFLNRDFDDCAFIQQESKETPTGKEIFLGRFCKKFRGNILMKQPADAEVIAELRAAKKLI